MGMKQRRSPVVLLVLVLAVAAGAVRSAAAESSIREYRVVIRSTITD
jgi:hypothetical protein